MFIVANNIDELGGVIRFSHTLAGLLAQQGHRVHLIGVVHARERFDYGDNLPYDTHVLHERHPPRVGERTGLARLNPKTQLRRIVRDGFQRIGARRLSRLLRGAGPGSVVIVTQIYAMEWVRLAHTDDVHLIGMSHESYAASLASTRYERVLRYYRNADRLLLLTQVDADDWAADGLTNVGVMPNPLGVTTTSRAPVQDKVVISLGRFSWEKGFDLLLDAWAELADRFPDWSLHLYGEGPDEGELRQRCDELGLSTVQFRGRTSDVAGVLAGASIYALASRHEGMPVVLTEALEFGVPCVAFDVSPGVREVVSDGEDGIVVPPGNTSRFADALAVLMSDAALRRQYGQHGHESMRRFEPDRVVERWEQEFRLLDL